MASAPVRDQLGDHLITPQNAALVLIDYQPSQFATVRSRALLVVASAYLFTGMMAALFALTFPGRFPLNGLGAGLQTSAWIYNLRQIGFPLALIVYALPSAS